MITSPSMRKRLLIGMSMLLLVAFIVLNVALWPYARYFVGRDSHCNPEAHALLANARHIGITAQSVPCADSRCLLMLPAPGTLLEARGQRVREQLTAYGITPAPYGELRGIVVLLHGRGSCKENQVYTALRLTAAGLAVIAPDLPGHGDNPNNPSGYGILPGESDIAVAALDAARQAIGEHLPAALWGHSMGSSYANYTLAAHPERFSALIIQSGFDSMDNVLRDHLPPTLNRVAGTPLLAWFRLLVRLRGGADIAAIRPGDAAATHRLPVLQIHGAQDRLISLARGQALAERYLGEKQFITVSDGDHHNVMSRATLAYAPAVAFILHHP